MKQTLSLILTALLALASAGQPLAPELDGVNLLPYVTGEKKETPHQTLYWRWVDQAAIQEYPYKLILVGRNQSLLFAITLPEGAHHTRELSAKHPEIAKRLRAKLDLWMATLTRPGPPQALQREGHFTGAKLLTSKKEQE